MRIAYSCAGEGFGHAARMVALSRWLERRHHVSYFAPETVQAFLAEKLPGIKPAVLPALVFAKHRDRVDLAETVLTNLPTISQFPITVQRLARQLKRAGIQAVISDFEPFLTWAARLAGIPVFQMNHPGIVARCVSFNPNSWLHAVAAKLLEGPWTRRAHISFYKGDIGPLFRPSLFKPEVRRGDYLVVNLSKESYRRPVLHALAQVCPNLPVRVFPQAGADFEAALAGCLAVISSAGHQIIAEAMVLGKPILVLPQQGQWEQVLNARMLTKTGRGMTSSFSRLNHDLLKFIAHLPQMEAKASQLPAGFSLTDGSAALSSRIEAFLDQAVASPFSIVPTSTARTVQTVPVASSRRWA